MNNKTDFGGTVYRKLNQKDLECILAYFVSGDVGERSKGIMLRLFRHVQYQDNQLAILREELKRRK